MKVLMAEDEEPLRERLRVQLAGAANAQLRCVTQDAVVLMLTAAAWRPDVVILDIFMRDVAALELREAIKRLWPGISVVIAARMEQPRDYLYLKYSAEGVLDKTRLWDRLAELMHEA